jgi:hypothetical protein
MEMKITTALIILMASTCIASITPYDDVNDFKTAVGGEPQYMVDFETFANGNPVPSGDYPINGDEWSNWGVQFAPIETGYSLILSAKEGMNVSQTGVPGHALAIADLSPGDDRSSFLITFSTPVAAFGVYIVDNETRDLAVERIILKDKNDNVLGDYDMPGGAGPAPPIAQDFVGYISDIPIAEIQIIEDNDLEGALLDNVMYSIPEPATLLLLAAGAFALRKKHRQ